MLLCRLGGRTVFFSYCRGSAAPFWMFQSETVFAYLMCLVFFLHILLCLLGGRTFFLNWLFLFSRIFLDVSIWIVLCIFSVLCVFFNVLLCRLFRWTGWWSGSARRAGMPSLRISCGERYECGIMLYDRRTAFLYFHFFVLLFVLIVLYVNFLRTLLILFVDVVNSIPTCSMVSAVFLSRIMIITVSRSLKSWVATIQIGRTHSWRFSSIYF